MADEGVNSAGSVSVDVVPNGKQFGSRLKALVVAAGNASSSDLADALTSKIAASIVEAVVEGVRDGGRAALPEAAKAGREAGAAYADAFKSATEGLGDGHVGPSAAVSAKDGAEDGEAFAEGFKARAEAVFDRWDGLDLDVDDAKAYAAIAEIKAELDALHDERVGIEIDVDDADTAIRLESIRALVAAVAAESPTITVDAKTDEAAIELDDVALRAAALGADSPTIDVNVDGSAAVAELGAIKAEADSVGSSGLTSAGGLGALATTIVTLLPAGIPVAAALAVAVAGIGAAGFGAAAGIIVEALALSRVAGVLKDMGAAQAASNKVTGGGTSNAFAYASALDGLKSAQAAYANTVANAADQQRQAAEAVVNAEQSVADAQRSALQAQVALTEAKKQAQQQEEDLANSIIDGAISQQQAVLDQTTAHAKLTQLQNNHVAAGDPQLVQAQIDAEAADQRVKELALTQQRLTDQQQQATTAGIDGAAGVVSAQQGVLKANEQVAKAEQSLSDARLAQASQARQAAYSIAQAQQGIVSAQRALAQSTAGVGGASSSASAAATKLAQDMAKLTPQGRAFATFVFGLKGDLSDLQGLAEKGILPGAETFLKDLIGTYLPEVKSTVAGVSNEVGKLEVSAGKTFTNPFWRAFFTFLEGEAVPSLDGLYRVGVNVATGLAGIVRAGDPLAHEFGGGLITFTQKFADASMNLSNNPSFQRFLADAKQEGPQVAHTIGEVADALAHVTAALSPIGNVEIRVIGQLADVIDEIPLPVLTALAAVFILVNLGLKTYNAYVAIATNAEKAWTFTQKTVGDLLGLLPGRAAAAATATEALAAGETAAADAAVGAETSLGLLTDFLGGPLGLALGLAGAAFALFSNHTADNSAEVGQLTGSLGQLADAFKNVATNGTTSIQQLVAQNADLQQFVINASKLGIAVGTIQSALAGDPAAAAAINAAYAQRIALIQAALTAEQNVAVKFTLPQVNAAEAAAGLPQAKSPNELILGHGTDNTEATLADLKAQQAAYQKQAAALQQAGQAQSILNSQVTASLALTKVQTPAQLALSDAYQTLGDKTATASDQVSALKSASDAIYGSIRAAADANEAYFASIDQVNHAIDQNGRSLSLSSAAGRANVDAVKAQLDASNQLYFADIADGKSADVATKAHDARTAALVQEAAKGGLNKTAVQSLIDIYGQVPTDVKTEISVVGANAALTQLENLQIAQQALASGIDVETATREYLNSHKQAQKLMGGLAAGGPVVGPGTKTSDSVPIWASAGEFMQPAAAVDYYGHGIMAAMQARAVPKELFQGLARGGLVRWPFVVNEHDVHIPSLAQVKAVMVHKGAVPAYASGGYIPPGVAPSYTRFQAADPGGSTTVMQQSGPAAPVVQIDHFYAGDAGAPEIAAELDWRLKSAGG